MQAIRSRRPAWRLPSMEVPTFARVLQRLGLTAGGAMLLGAAALGWLLARLLGSRTLYLLVYGGLVVLALAWWLGRQRQSLDAVRSELPPRVRQGQLVEVELTFSARRRVSGLVLEERLHPHLGRTRRIQLDAVRPGQPATYRYAITPQLRGVYPVGPLTAIWTDPFGFTRREVVVTEPAEILVHPQTEGVQDTPLTRQWEDPPVRPPVSKPWPTGFDFYGMRRYAPGDDLRRVVWRAVARTGRVMVREFEQGITDRVALVIDTDARQHSAGDPSDTFEAAVRAAASLGLRYLKDGFAVTVETNGRTVASAIRGVRAQTTFLDDMARLQRETEPLQTAVDRVVRGVRRDVHHVVITPHVDDRAATRLKLLIDQGAYVVLVVLVWEESGPQALAHAASLGCQVVQLRPRTPLGAVMGGSSRVRR
ncbi:MAG TPA: DUF58 domain-containing protein [Candidatus Dormibacteraeota bacterium]|nr:DUF58 domain-containing protein [Candidatus Dormibacteraeota bacterium]